MKIDFGYLNVIQIYFEYLFRANNTYLIQIIQTPIIL